MVTAIIVVVLAVAMMLGPIMLMQPTKRQRRLARLRSLANNYGLELRMLVIPRDAVHAGESVAVYAHPWPGKKPAHIGWLLTRRSFSHGIHFAADWDWSSGEAAPAWQDVLRRAVVRLPQSVVAVEGAGRGLGLGWLEQLEGKSEEQALDELHQWLIAVLDELPLPKAAPSEEENLS